jgi:hypothetical protein
MNEIEAIVKFIEDFEITEHIPEMEENLTLAIGFSQRIGTLVNTAEYNYTVKKAKALEKLLTMDEETETTRKAKLENDVAEERRTLQDLKVMARSLKSIIMSLMQAIKTRREERE